MRAIIPPIKNLIGAHIDEFRPPLRDYTQEEVLDIFNRSQRKEEEGRQQTIRTGDLLITRELKAEIAKEVSNFANRVPGVDRASVTLDGGYEIFTYSLTEKFKSAGTISSTLFDASKAQAYMLKKTSINNVTCQCQDHSHFIYYLNGGVFSVIISKESVRFGLMRILIPIIIKKLNAILAKFESPPEKKLDLRGFDWQEALRDFNTKYKI